jgi:hypothetical protein
MLHKNLGEFTNTFKIREIRQANPDSILTAVGKECCVQ